MKIFVSSTIYDLVDLRAELFAFLSELGAEIFMSEIVDSDFDVKFDKSSIENCIINARNADFVILVIDKRYGPSLKDHGYQDMSATHLEYLEAKKAKRPILLLVRDRTFSEYSIFKKSIDKKKFDGSWVRNREIKLFDLIDEHARLSKKGSNNWVHTFSNCLDAKKIVGKAVRARIIKDGIPRRIASGDIPLISVDLNFEYPEKGNNNKWKFNCTLKNNGKCSVFVKNIYWINARSADYAPLKIFSPTETMYISFISVATARIENNLIMEYSTYDGVAIREKYLIVGAVSGGILSGVKTLCDLVEREFLVEDPIKFEVI